MLTTAFLALFIAAADVAPRPVPAVVPESSLAAIVASSTTEALLERATGLLVAERFTAARDLYRELARKQVAAGESPVGTLRLIADTYFYAGGTRQAIAALHEVAQTAASYGDLAAQAKAYVDVAALLQSVGSTDQAIEARARAERLLASPNFPASDREAIRTRLSED